jgi:malonyl CoA-acyl carrier protein transacylase
MLHFREEFRNGEAGGSPLPAREDRAHGWDTELFIVRAADRAGLLHRTASLQDFLRYHPNVDLKDLAYTLNTEPNKDEKCLAVVAASSVDLHARLTKAAERLTDPARAQIRDASGIYYFDRPLHDEGTLALLFPGEGAQYLNMLTDLCPYFPEIEQSLEDAERLAQRASPSAGHAFRSVFHFSSDATEEQRAEAEKALRQLDTAIFSVMLADWAIFQLLSRLGLKPAAVAGHSMGEVPALQAAGCIDQNESVLAHISSVLNVFLSREAAGEIAPAVLLAVGAGKNIVEQAIRDSVGVGAFVAMDNCPHQSVVVGPPALMVAIEAELQKRRFICERLPFDRPYHTPLMEPYLGPLCDLYDKVEFRAAQTTIYSCSTGLPFPSKPHEIRHQAVWQHAMPVEFTRLIKNMHADGVRVFVECGPRGNLTAFTEDILRGERFTAIASNLPHRSGVMQLNHLAAQLAAHGVPLSLEHFYSHRDPQRLKWDDAGETSSIVAEVRTRTGATGEANEPAAYDQNGLSESGTLPVAETPPGSDVSTAAYTLHDDASPVIAAASDRSKVAMQYFGVMEQFLDDQSETMNAYLARIRHSDGPTTDHEPSEKLRSLVRLPMLRNAKIVRFEAGQEIVVQRKLDLAEDLFVSHHTIGGQAVSKVDPDQHGLPVMPMTFSLEMMAELASVLAPNHVVVCLKSIRLFRWLAFSEAEPTSVEISAQVLTEAAPGAGAGFQVRVEVRELVGPAQDEGSRSPAAQGVVVLAEHYAEPPPAGEFSLTNEHLAPVPLDVMYKNLFHGPLFQGAQGGGKSGDEGIESDVLVLPRHQLLRSDPDPNFLIDPVLLDVSMHPITGWHLEFPDQSGRILLPIELEKLELFGPRPKVGIRFISRGSMLASSYRNFIHAVDLIDQDGKLWSRMHRLTFWRFYVPFANVNFHGPKDEYFISKEWHLAVPRLVVPASCIRLDIPSDQKQELMRSVTAKVILAPEELAQFRAVAGDEQRECQWLFDRLAGKDAIRVLWHARHGERLFPADIIIEMNENGAMLARPRGPSGHEPFPTLSVARTDDVVAALAAFGPYAGIALAHLPSGGAGLEETVFHSDERLLLDQFGPDRDEWITRLRCAKQAISKALNCGVPDDSEALAVCDADPETGAVKIKLRSPLSDLFPEWRSGALVAHTARDDSLVVATTFCERVSV